MLERPALWIATSSPTAPREIRDAATGEPVGRVVYRRQSWAAAWRPVTLLSIEEGTDLALVCTLRREPWWRDECWLLDSDAVPVARWRRPVLDLVRDDLRLTVDGTAHGLVRRAWLNGAVAADWGPADGGTRLSFAESTEALPLLRMAVLGVVV